MAQTNYTPISLYYSATASNVPTAANLVPGELAINTADGKLYYEDSSGVVQVLATKSTGSIGGSNTQVQFNNNGSLGGSSGLTWDGSFLTTSSIKNSALTSGRVTYAGASGLLTDSATLTFNGSVLSTPTLYPTASSGVGIQMTSTGNNNGYWTIANNFGQMIVGTEGSAGSLVTGSSQGSALIGNAASNPLQFFTNNTVRATLTNTTLYTASGVNVGIGTSSPSFPLQIVGSVGGYATSIGGSTYALRVYTDTTQIQMNGTNGTEFISMFPASNYMAFGTNNAERMRIDSSGNVGIGATSAGNKLQISNGGANGVEFDVALASGTESKMLSINRSSSAYTPLNYDASLHKFFISGGEKMRLDASGNLLVGTTSTTVNPGIVVYGNLNNAQIQIGHASGVASGEGYMGFQYNGSAIGSITQNGTTGVLYNIVSDQRLKTNIVDAPSGNIDDIKVRSFDWIADGSHQEYGMVAQELIEVAPYAVHQPENPDDMMGVDYSKLVPMMIKEIQDLKQRILTLENK